MEGAGVLYIDGFNARGVGDCGHFLLFYLLNKHTIVPRITRPLSIHRPLSPPHMPLKLLQRPAIQQTQPVHLDSIQSPQDGCAIYEEIGAPWESPLQSEITRINSIAQDHNTDLASGNIWVEARDQKAVLPFNCVAACDLP